MNCKEYREAVGADPTFDGGKSHLAGCSECRSWQREIQALNLRIAKAMMIEVPPLEMPDLPEIEAANVTALPVQKRAMKPLWFAVAATVVLAASISLRMSGVFDVYDSLADEVLAHIDHEPAALRITDTAVSDQDLARAVPAQLATFERGASLITYAQPCVINGNLAPHLVMQGEHGPVTIILMAGEKVAEVTPIDGEHVRGLIIPVGDGSIAIIGDREETLEAIKNNVLESVTWTT